MRGSVENYPRAAVERAMMVQQVGLPSIAKKITWWQAAEISGRSGRQLRSQRGAFSREADVGTPQQPASSSP
jgi:hypothetical protein